MNKQKLEILVSGLPRADLTNFDIEHYIKVQSKFIEDCYVLELERSPDLSKTDFVFLYTMNGNKHNETYAKRFHDYYFGLRHKPHWGELDIQQHNGAK